jgi:hypothetical protein
MKRLPGRANSADPVHRRSCLGCFALLVGIPVALVIAFALFCEWQFRSWVHMGGQRNRLVCEVRTTDGSTLPEVSLVFRAADGFRYIPLSGLAGRPPERNISRTYQFRTAVPGSVSVEWPRLYLSLAEVRIGPEVATIDWRRGTLVAQWDNYVRRYAPEGHPISEGGGSYTATILIEPATRTISVKRPDN